MAGKNKIPLILFLVPLFVFMASGNEEHSSNFVGFLGKAINFIVLFGGLAYFLSKPVRNFLEKRSQDIDRSLKEAENSKREAESRLQEAKARLAGLEDEIAKIKKEGEMEGRREKDRTIQIAHQEAERINYFAKKEIEVIVRTGIQELKEYAAELATALAEERIKKRMSRKDQYILINKSIGRFGKLYEKSDSDKEIHSRIS